MRVLSSNLILRCLGQSAMALDRDRLLGVLVCLLTLVGVALFFVPAFIIRPFRYQSPGALSLAIAVKWVAPALSTLAFLAVVILGFVLWRRVSRGARVALIVAVVLSAASATMTRLNYFEWMFQPIQAAGFLSAREANLADREMVLAVRIGPEAHAYAIRQMAYHHILNDTVAGVPIAVTY